MMKTAILTLFMVLSGFMTSAQTLEKMNWFNEPAKWDISDDKLIMHVTPKSDY